nr:hypothetical protein [Nitrosopumilus sp.]MBA3551083.1 hypothetical protein [Patescibacteria group bacterium]
MKIIYIANTRIPTEKAHGYQIVQVCSELVCAGASMELWVPSRKNSVSQDAFCYYGIKKNFEIIYISSIDFFRFEKLLGKLTYYFQSLGFLFSLMLKSLPKDAVVYTRNPEIIFLMNLKGITSVYNAHNWPTGSSYLFKKLIAPSKGIVCN